MITTLTQWRSLLVGHRHLFPLLLTLGAYSLAVSLQRVGRQSALLNPTLLAIATVVAVLWLLKVDYNAYFGAAQPVHFLLGPAVVALAIPLYRHAELVRERAVDLLTGLAVGSLTGVATGLAVAAQIGGIPPVTAVLTILAGVTGAVASSYVLDVLRVRDPAIRGFSMGLASHGIATARAFQESDTAGTFAGIAMGLNAVATAVLVPIVLHLMFR